MFASTRFRPPLALAGLLAACQPGSQPTTHAVENSDLFEARPANWRPLSATLLNFYHVERSTAGRANLKTYVETLRADVFRDLYGNLALSSGDASIARLTDDADGFMLMVPSGFLTRIDSTKAFVTQIEEARYSLRHPGLEFGTAGEIFLFPDRATLDDFARYIDSGAVPGLKPLRQIAKGCLYSRLAEAANGRETAILLAHVPDRELSLGDPADRQCLNAFFLENMGVRRDKADLVVPGLPKTEYGDCSIARIYPMGATAPARSSLACPTAPNRRAAMLVHFFSRLAAAGNAKAAALADTVRARCADLSRRGNRDDLSCNEAAKGVS